MFGQHDHKDDKDGAPAVPPAGTLNTSNGIPDDHAVTQMLADSDVPSISPHPPTPAPGNSFMPFSGTPPSAPEPSNPHPATAPPAPAEATSAPFASTFSSLSKSDMTTEDLVRMKQEALQHLQPLVGTLHQNPEEEFRTLMMMIQATDDKSMLNKALDAAKRISDDKIRAQAMLDVINEINYFTQVDNQ